MLEKKEYQGYFYIPEAPDKKIAGILYFYPNEKIRLELIGACLSGKSIGSFCRHDEVKVIFGIVRTEDGTSKVTLFNCFGSGSKSYSNIQNCEICLTNYSCSYLLLGIHLSDKENKVFNKIRFSFPGFNDWYRDNEILFDCENDYKAIFTITNDHKNPKKIKLNENETLIINGYSGHYDINHHEKCLFERSYIELESTAKSKLVDLLIKIAWFKDFYSFAAMTTMPFSEIYLYNNENPNPVMFLFIAEERFEKKDKFFCHYFLFDFQTIASNFEIIIQTWYEKRENSEPIIQQLISSVTYHRFIKSSDFLIVIQAVEGYYQRFVEDTRGLTKILQNLYDKYNDVQVIRNNKPDLKQVVDSRDHYSHILPEGKKENVCKGFELYSLAEKLKPLLIGCILTLIGVDNEGINRMLQNYYQWNSNIFIEIK